jgi:NAD(P)-dependent dehydrogenase (short-subunit alcohol dehydrogenase family)
MSQPICLVTGANSGLGKEIALALAKAGAHVIMVCRNAIKGELAFSEIKQKSGSTSVDLLIADLSSQNDIRALADTIHKRYTKLTILINNAGVVQTKKVLSVDGVEMTLATNHYGPFLLTQLLLDLLMQGAPARIINISSAIHKWAKIDLNDLQYSKRKYHFMKAYAQSKLLMNIYTYELARKLAGSGVTVNCVHPGAVKTGLGSANANGWLLKLIDKVIKFFFITPEKAAKSPVSLALSSEMNGVSGNYYARGKATQLVFDSEIAKKVWELSAKEVGLEPED